METMTREKEMEQAADEYFAHSWSGSVKDAFREGAQWADKNSFPNFISVKDRLPELRECVLVLGVVDVNIPIFNSDGNGFLLLKFHEEYKITHWFPIPKLDGKELYERI